MRPIGDPLLAALVNWRDDLAETAGARGDKMFMGIPDAWFEDPHWFCTNGHVSHCVLRSDSGASRCLACREVVILGPSMSEAMFSRIADELATKVART